jgi:hypothetical protein
VDESKPPDFNDETYVISAGDEVEIPAKWLTVATYELEQPAKCPHCRAHIRTLKVVKLTRSRVSFTSTLPRGGRALVCPECDSIISAEASGLI